MMVILLTLKAWNRDHFDPHEVPHWSLTGDGCKTDVLDTYADPTDAFVVLCLRPCTHPNKCVLVRRLERKNGLCA